MSNTRFNKIIALKIYLILICIVLVVGCTDFSDLAFSTKPDDNLINPEDNVPITAYLIFPVDDVVGQLVSIKIQTQGSPSKVIVAYNGSEYQCTNEGGSVYTTTISLDITKNPNVHTFHYWAEDAQGVKTPTQQKTVRWAYHFSRRIGGDNVSSANDCGLGVVVDSQGNVYVVGVLAKTTTGSDTNVAEDWGESDVIDTDNSALYSTWTFVMKIHSDGSYGWTKTIGEASKAANVTAHALAVDMYGNIYVAGRFSQTVNFASGWNGTDSRTSSGVGAFVLKIHSDGTYGGTKIIPSASGYQVIPYAMAFDGSNNMYLTGYFWTGATTNYIDFASDWGSADQKAPNGQADCFITCIIGVPNNGWSSSQYGWTKRIGGSSTDQGKALLLCEDETTRYLYIAGDYLSNSINFASDWESSDSKGGGGSYSDIFLTKLGIDISTGQSEYKWTKVICAGSTSHWGSPVSLAKDGQNNVYLAGFFTGNNVNFAADWSGVTDSKTSKDGNQDVFVTLIKRDDSYGTTKRFGAGSTNYDYPTTIVSDLEGNLYLSGYFQSTCNFAEDFGNTDSKTARGSFDIFITKFNLVTNSYSWAKTFGSAQNDRQTYANAIPRLYYDSTKGYLYLAETVNVGNNNSININFGEDFYYDDTKTTKKMGEAIVCKLQP